jgi:hypothetical protein
MAVRLVADAEGGENDPDHEEDERDGEEESGSRARAPGNLTQPVVKPHGLERLEHGVTQLRGRGRTA